MQSRKIKTQWLLLLSLHFQIEINPCLYLGDRWIDSSEMKINENRLKVLNQRFQKVVELFYQS